ncbi:hypothetical protein [Defluviimonas sp. SAOS-178_SWC]
MLDHTRQDDWADGDHLYSRDLDGEGNGDALPFRREITELAVE